MIMDKKIDLLANECNELIERSISALTGKVSYVQFRRFGMVVEYGYQVHDLFFRTQKHT